MNYNDKIDVQNEEIGEFDEIKSNQTNLEEDKIETKGLKLRKSTKERLNALQSKYGDAESMIVALLNQNDTFSIESGEKYSDRKAEIEKFNYLLESIKSSYISSLDMANYLEEKYVDKFTNELKKKEQMITSLQNENIKIKELAKNAEVELRKKEAEVKEVKESFARINLALTTVEKELSEKSQVIQNAQKHITTLTEVSKEAQNYKQENEKLISEINNLREVVLKNALLKQEIEGYKRDISRVNNDYIETKNQLMNEKVIIADLNDKIQHVITASSREINTIKDECNKKILEIEAEKNKNLMMNNEMIYSLKDEIHRLQIELMKK